MSKLIYVTNMSLDGYIEDEHGSINFFPVDAEVFRSHTDLLQSAGTFLYGRRLYESMAVWETDATLAARSDDMAEFAAAWQAADKVVYSTALTAASTAKTRIERHLDPAAVRALKESASRDITVGGANLASQALEAGLVDECQLYVLPTVLGRGKPALPVDATVDLELVDERRFGNGVVLLRYRPLGRPD
jgi:dihydrofolate reductase